MEEQIHDEDLHGLKRRSTEDARIDRHLLLPPPHESVISLTCSPDEPQPGRDGRKEERQRTAVSVLGGANLDALCSHARMLAETSIQRERVAGIEPA